ncbi:MAG: Xaa-Pro peptidase family protein [bacterium]|nr:Xaa-Pro peptidase family protein [bacterium]
MYSQLSKLRKEMSKHHLDAVLISSVSNITYLTGYSGFSPEEREAFLFIVAQPQGLTHKTPGVTGYIITDGRYSEAVHAQIKNFELIERTADFPFEKILKDLAKKLKIKRVGFEENNITVSEYKILSSCFNDLNHFNITDLRIIKDSSEIKSIKKACELGDKTFKYILKKIKPGVSEKELAFEIELFIRKSGANISFPPIVAFGANSSIPHHQAGNTKLGPSTSSGQKGQFVLFDFGVKLNNYCSDMTRTVFLGKATTKQRRMYQTVLEAQKRAIEYLNSCFIIHDSRRETIKASEVDKVARTYITKQGFPTIPHSLGHGVGLEVHELPRLSPKSQPKAGQPLAEKDVLKPGMVFSLEPGIYVPGFGSPRSTRVEAGGVRIEDLVVLERSGPRLLTKSPRELIELSSF